LCTLLRHRELDEPRATAGDALPQAGQRKNKPLRGRWARRLNIKDMKAYEQPSTEKRLVSQQ